MKDIFRNKTKFAESSSDANKNFPTLFAASLFTDDEAQLDKMHKLLINLILLALLFGLTFCIGFYVIQGFNSKAIYPPNIRADAMNALVAAKITVIEGWWATPTAHLSWPSGLNLAGFPLDGNLYMALLKTISLFSSNPFVIICYSVLATALIGAGLAYYALRLIGVVKLSSLIFAIIFAFSPSFYYRHFGHMHSMPYLVPIACSIAVLIFTGKAAHLSRFTKTSLLFLSFTLGASYSYTVAFSLFLITLATIRQLLLKNSEKQTKVFALVSITFLLGGFLLSNIPTFVAYNNDPALSVKLLSFKSPSEADVYGLNIRTLFRDVPGQGKVYSHIDKVYRKANFKQDIGEGTGARLGTFGSLGLLFLLVNLFLLPCSIRNTSDNETELTFYCLSILVVASILLAVPGGFGSMINMFSPQIRAYNRISPYIGFFAIMSLALLFGKLCKTLSDAPTKVKAFAGVLALLIAVFASIVDQQPHVSGRCQAESQDVASAQMMLNEFRPLLPPEAKILFLPVMTYPSTPPEGKMPAQQDALPFLLDNNYFWSVMPLAPAAEHRLRSLIAYRGMDFVVRAAGNYDAVLYDTRADTPGYVELVRSLTLPQVQNVRSRDGNYQLFLLSGIKPTQTSFLNDLFNPDEPTLLGHSGWYEKESWGTWSRLSDSNFNLLVQPRPYVLTLRLHAFIGNTPSRTITVEINGKEVRTVTFTNNQSKQIEIQVPKTFTVDNCLRVSLKTVNPLMSPNECAGSSDLRKLGFGLSTIRLRPLDKT